jgi:subtilisin-like proprotein convertase family protein
LPQTILTVDDPNPMEPADSTPPSEAETITVSQSGTYYAYVDVGKGKTEPGGETATYELAVTVFPAAQPSCRTYSSSVISAFLDGGTTSFPIQVDDPALVARAALRLKLEESVMQDLDVSLRSPSGFELPLFTDIGESAAEGQRQMEAVFDDFAATPSLYTSLRPLGLQTDSPLAGFNGQPTQGTWTLVVKDDTANLPPSVGSLAAAELVLCPQPGSEPGAPAGGGNSAARPQAKPAQPPVLSGFTIAPSKFRAAESGPMVRAKRSPLGGALVGYQSSEPVQTNLILFELEEGRKVGRKCARPTALNSAKKPCVRPVKVISFVRNDSAGRNQFGFTGRVGARKLPPGEYKLQARAYAGSGLTSAAVSGTFTVLPPAPKEAKPRRG